MNKPYATLHAEIDLRWRTDFLKIEGSVICAGTIDPVVTEAADQGPDRRELVLDVTGAARPDPSRIYDHRPFSLQKMVSGPAYDRVRARFGNGIDDLVVPVRIIAAD